MSESTCHVVLMASSAPQADKDFHSLVFTIYTNDLRAAESVSIATGFADDNALVDTSNRHGHFEEEMKTSDARSTFSR